MNTDRPEDFMARLEAGIKIGDRRDDHPETPEGREQWMAHIIASNREHAIKEHERLQAQTEPLDAYLEESVGGLIIGLTTMIDQAALREHHPDQWAGMTRDQKKAYATEILDRTGLGPIRNLVLDEWDEIND